jgi:hypothetical protein
MVRCTGQECFAHFLLARQFLRCATAGIGSWYSSPSSTFWNDAESEKIALPCWIATTELVAKLRPSRIRSTVVDDRGGGITRTHEIGMQRMHRPVGSNGALRRHQRLADHLTAKDPLPSHLRACSAEQVLFEPFNVEAESNCSMADGAVRDILVLLQVWL